MPQSSSILLLIYIFIIIFLIKRGGEGYNSMHTEMILLVLTLNAVFMFA